MEKILVTGASGLLGSACCYEYSKKLQVHFTYNSNEIKIAGCTGFKADLSEPKVVQKLFENSNPDIVLHAAALTNLGLCEKDKVLAKKSNVLATKNIALECKKNKSTLVHISTNYVFDGKKGNYSEKSKPRPLNYYAKTKLLAEKQVQKIFPKSFIVRTSPFGWQPLETRANSATWFLKDLKEGKQVKAFTDQFASFILANDLALVLNNFFDSNKFGLYNVSAKDKVNRYFLTSEIAKLLGYDNNLVIPITMKEFEKNNAFLAKRAKDTSLDCSKFEKTFQQNLPAVKDALQRFKALHEQNYLQNFRLV